MGNPFNGRPSVEPLIERIAPMIEHRVAARMAIEVYKQCLADEYFFSRWLVANFGESSPATMERERAIMPSRIQALRFGLEATDWK